MRRSELVRYVADHRLAVRHDRGLGHFAGKRQELADGTQATAGPSGNKSWTLNSSRASAGFLAALRPS